MQGYKKKFSSQEMNFGILLKRCICFVIVYAIIYLAIALISSAILFNTSDPTSKIGSASLIALYLSALFSGFFMAKVNKEYYFSGGAILGFMVLFVCAAITFAFGEFTTSSFLVFCLIPAFCILGSVIGKKRDKKSFRRKRFVK